MEQYNVTGMSCAACSARVEKAVKKVPGVTSCSVSLLTNSMGVEGTASSAAIIQAVQEAGYGASPKAAGAAAASSPSADLDALADRKDAYVLYCGAIAKRWNLDIAQEDLHAKRYETAREMLVSAVDWREGAADFVRAARTLGFRTAIATTTKRRNVDIYSRENEGMRREGVLYDLFDAVVTREDVCAIKPDPECHRLLAERLGVTADETLVFEDSMIGLDAAKAAGMEVAVIDEPHSDAERAELNERADFTFRNWPSLQAVLLAECGSHKEVR